MSVNRKFEIIKRLLKLPINSLNNKQYFVTYSQLFLKELNSNLKIPLNITNRNLNRKYMDLSSVLKIFELEVPNYLAEKWDNTGLLIETSNATNVSTILFTNDLTEDVVEESLKKKPDLIISYHPPIFSPIKSLKYSNWKDRIVIKCIQNSISVYSPHTSCDAVAGGVNDWLIKCFDLIEIHPIHPSYEPQTKYSHILDCSVSLDQDVSQMFSSVPDSEVLGMSIINGKQNVRIKVNKTSLNHVRKILAEDAASLSVTDLDPVPISTCGIGRIGRLVRPLTLEECVNLVKLYLKLDLVRLSQGVSHSHDSIITTVAVCAGSGASVLKGVKADLYVTGEMSHHDLLDAKHRNVSVILCEHSNSERGYLAHLIEKLRPKLPGINLIMSSSDKDPICIA